MCLNKSEMNKTFKLEVTNITWKFYHLTPSDFAKIKMYDIINSGVNLPIAIRSWDSYVNPKLGYMKCIQDSNLVTIIVNSQPFLTPTDFKLKAPVIVVYQ